MKKFSDFVTEAKDPGEYDYEGEMAKVQLRAMIDQAEDLVEMFEDNENLPEWAQNKITKAADYIKDVYSYMEGQEDDDEMEEEYVSHAQRKAVWASRADGGKGHPDKKKKKK